MEKSEIVDEAPDESLKSQENPEVNIFFEDQQTRGKSESPRTVISEDDIEEERKKMEEDLKSRDDDCMKMNYFS